MYYHHKASAKQRGIGFFFTFEEWVSWWEKQLGPDWLSLRGVTKDSYCMTRRNDSGPYIAGNVECKTVSQNSRDAHKHQMNNLGIKKLIRLNKYERAALDKRLKDR